MVVSITTDSKSNGPALLCAVLRIVIQGLEVLHVDSIRKKRNRSLYTPTLLACTCLHCFFEVGDYNNNTIVLSFAAKVCKTVL